MKNFIIVTGGAGFVGSNLIELLIKKTNKKIISLDNYSTGNKKNHINNKRIKYLIGNTSDIKKKLTQYFILVNFLEYIKASKSLINVMIQIRLALKQFLNFVLKTKLN